MGRQVVVAGGLRPAMPGRSAVVKWRVDGNWRRLARVKLGDGRFRVKADAKRYGRRPVKVVFSGDRLNSYGKDRDRLRVHRRSLATWYGPGFFGRRTACGQRYDRDLLGVAHRSLSCGTKVSVLYRGRSVRVPVVDRGPYGEADWDLTEETADRLGFRGRERIGVLH
jgi:rare lipoprotein A (peptidoglycan hydrolase)